MQLEIMINESDLQKHYIKHQAEFTLLIPITCSENQK